MTIIFKQLIIQMTTFNYNKFVHCYITSSSNFKVMMSIYLPAVIWLQLFLLNVTNFHSDLFELPWAENPESTARYIRNHGPTVSTLLGLMVLCKNKDVTTRHIYHN